MQVYIFAGLIDNVPESTYKNVKTNNKNPRFKKF